MKFREMISWALVILFILVGLFLFLSLKTETMNVYCEKISLSRCVYNTNTDIAPLYNIKTAYCDDTISTSLGCLVYQTEKSTCKILEYTEITVPFRSTSYPKDTNATISCYGFSPLIRLGFLPNPQIN